MKRLTNLSRKALSLSLSLSLCAKALICIFMLWTNPANSQEMNKRFYDCNPAAAFFQGELPPTLCQQNPNFTPDITIPIGVTFASSLTLENTPWGQGWNGKKIRIIGKLVIDVDVSFYNCKVQMREASEIYTQGDVDLKMYVSQFFSCTKMWRGIHVYGGGYVKSQQTKYEDAEAALTLEDGAVAYLKWNQFNRNDYGIRNGDATSGQSGMVFEHFTLNTFDCNSPLLPPYTGQPYAPGSVSFAGILLDHCTATIGQKTNTNWFYRMQHGVYARYSDVVVQNCKFEGMVEEAGSSNDWHAQSGGIGVAGFDGKITVRESSVSSSGNIGGPCFFTDCTYAGVSTGGTNLEVRNATFTGSNFIGIDSWGNLYGETVKITKNKITMNKDSDVNMYGIAVVRSIASGNEAHCIISRNKIEIGGTGEDKFGIYVWDNFPAIDIMEVSNNRINVTSTEKYVEGIRIDFSDADNFNLFEDTIDFTTTATLTARAGIAATRCDGIGNIMKSNRVNDINGVTSNSAHGGIWLVNAENWTLCQNVVNRTQVGLFFQGDCEPAYVQANTIKAHERGLLVEHLVDNSGNILDFGAIGEQLRHDNRWSAVQSDYSLFAAQCTADPEDSEFIVQDNTTAVNPPKKAPIDDWFFLESGNLNNCSGISSESPTVKLTRLDIFAMSEISTSEYAWERKKKLVYKLLRFPALAPVGSDAYVWLNNQLQTSTGKLASVDHMIFEAVKIDAITQQQLNNLESERNAFFESLTALDNSYELPQPDTLVENTAFTAAKRALFDSLELRAIAVSQIEAQIRSNRVSAMSAISSYNQAIATTVAFETNQKQLNTLLIKQAKEEALTDTDIDLADTIADQTLGSKGHIEVLANSLLPICEAPGGLHLRSAVEHEQKGKNQAPLTQEFDLVPNPTQASLEIRFAEPQAAEIQVSSLSGQQMLHAGLETPAASTILDVSALPDGVYFLNVRNTATGAISTRKFIIQH